MQRASHPVQPSSSFSQRVNIAVYNAVLEHSKAKGAALAFLLVLAKWADDDGVCWPSVASIAKLMHCSTRTVQTLLQKLVQQKELAVEIRGSDRKTNRYRICSVAAAPRVVKKTAKRDEVPNTCTQKTVFTGSKKQIPSPVFVPVPDPDLKKAGKEKQCSNREEPVKPKPPAVSPPVVQQSGFGYTDEQRREYARQFHKIISREAYELRLPLSKSQVRGLRNAMTLKLLPYPKAGSWLARQMQRPI